MSSPNLRSRLARLLSEHGMVLVLLGLGGYYSLATITEQHPVGAAAGELLAHDAARVAGPGTRVLIVAGATAEDAEFAESLRNHLVERGVTVAGTVRGQPGEARQVLGRLAAQGGKLDAVLATPAAGNWAVLQNVGRRFPTLGPVPVLTPHGYRWPNFLKADNLLNIANQIAVIAILAVGMTVVIIAGGIDLSVGSLIALAAVVATLLIRDAAGAEAASAVGMTACCVAAVGLCGFVGLGSGVLVTTFALPPFLVTLAMMLVASGLAYHLAQGQSVYQVPEAFVWLGRGADVAGIPNAVLLTALLYAAAHVLLTRTTLGRYLYAVGGNAEAARLSGVPVRRVLWLAYALSGALAGLGGVVMASQLRSGSPTYGQMYELYVVAAVVVGGTSLSGGEGTVLGTLVGALIIAVIQNGMNLTNVESYTQKVVLGAVILGAVLLDRLKKRTWSLPRRFARSRGAGLPEAATMPWSSPPTTNRRNQRSS
jgi:ribose transport system permease protein